MQTAIPARSIRPYMWIVTGPRSIVPDDGEGIEARNVTAGILPRNAAAVLLEENLQRQVGGTAGAHEVGRVVEVDVEARRDQRRRGRLEARALELLRPPACDPLPLRLRPRQLYRRHLEYLRVVVPVLRPVHLRGCPLCGGFR